ncbi:MAG: DegV family protein [Dysosmobacter welbionis]
MTEILAMLEEMIPRVETSFVLDRLDYMKKGGRCSPPRPWVPAC